MRPKLKITVKQMTVTYDRKFQQEATIELPTEYIDSDLVNKVLFQLTKDDYGTNFVVDKFTTFVDLKVCGGKPAETHGELYRAIYKFEALIYSIYSDRLELLKQTEPYQREEFVL